MISDASVYPWKHFGVFSFFSFFFPQAVQKSSLCTINMTLAETNQLTQGSAPNASLESKTVTTVDKDTHGGRHSVQITESHV